jgi:7,8-dihydropterin-6-yl-methyl-4-(beta-D-ribofuranosyl)aminobenzene 5'-phosphate synthase
MRIKVLYDKQGLEKKFRTGWGLSFLIDGRILFDTGEKGEWLVENMQFLGVNINKIEAVVISHDHWDHHGGLWEILRLRKGLKVYICPGFSREFKNKAGEYQAELIEAGKPVEITQNIFITGEIPGAYKGKYMPEQAVVLKTENGLTVITGCAHPGILKIIEKVKSKFPEESIYFVLGGFHLVDLDRRAVEIVSENFKRVNVLKAGPTHCSGDIGEDIFRKVYNENFMPIRVGQIMEV